MSPLLLCGLMILVLQSSVKAIDSRCSAANCQLPRCRCPGHGIPGGLKPEETPQMVLVTFDDAVNWDNWEMYLRLFPPEGNRTNPNGCPLSATFFVSHNFTDYCMVRKLHARQMEIADHSVTHRMPHAWWAEAGPAQIAHEIVTQRQQLADLAHIPLQEIYGWRSPFLQPSGDNMFEVLHQNNFSYDATLTYPFPRNVYSPVLWPFTLDFSYPLPCNIKPCPVRPYPGLWIVPVVVVMDYRQHLPCAYIDHCTNEPRNYDEAFEMLWKNFLRNYRTNRAPLYVNLHSKWLETAFHLDALDVFLHRLSAMDDVYVLSVQRALDWIQDPTPLSHVHDFRPWQCPGFRPNQEDEEACGFISRVQESTTTSATRSTTRGSPHYHTSLLGVLEEERLHFEDHNGIRRVGVTSGTSGQVADEAEGKSQGKVQEEKVEGGHRDHKGGHRDHKGGHRDHKGGHRDHKGGHRMRRPWFMRGGSSRGCVAGGLVVVMCGAVSTFLSLARA